ncbi:MAG: Flp pilus assembly complex ATPase component TadA [Candidatus Omnitrophica bacterium]|nr:Flp pilus assembly complex ATPase component TadA [Candidatus Omnitrophota bacterium]
MERKELGQILLEKGLITLEQLNEALELQNETKKFLGEILIEKGYIKKEDIWQALTEQKKADSVSLSKLKGLKPEIVKIIDENIARRFICIPIAKEDDILVVAMKDPADIVAIDTLRRLTGYKIKVVKGDEKEIIEFLDKFFSSFDTFPETISELEEISEEKEELDVDQLKVAAEDAPVIKFVNSLFANAIEKRATDIHLEPGERNVYIRFRIDGVLYNFTSPPKSSYPAIVTRIKILSNLDIGERRLPQDGRFKIKLREKEVDVRVSTLPTIYGEKVVLRLLDKEKLVLDLEMLGFEKEELEKFKKALKRPYGMIIVTGPTGSGKTTTLYSGLSFINTPEKNIITIEDPVEYQLEGINQVQVKPKIGLTFANVLRHILRQDPDVIMVGEIRDLETAQIAIQASLTGHLVITTLHTNDTVSTISRLYYMGVEPYLIADAVTIVISQRLVRKICSECKIIDKKDTETLKNLGYKEFIAYRGKGCSFCNYTGYYGRIGIFEVLEFTEGIREMILNKKSDDEIRDYAIKLGMKTLKESAIKKVIDGITSLPEAMTVTII